jgi:hypothetical protein
MLESLRRLFTSRYVSELEDEVIRLRAENRALLNSLLGTAGFPPLDSAELTTAVPRSRKRSWFQLQAVREAQATRSSERGAASRS